MWQENYISVIANKFVNKLCFAEKKKCTKKKKDPVLEISNPADFPGLNISSCNNNNTPASGLKQLPASNDRWMNYRIDEVV